MPRRKKTLEERKFPKTTGIKAVGSCGHEYTARIQLGYFAGLFRTPENVAGVDTIVKSEQKARRDNTCPMCHAIDLADMYRDVEQALVKWLGVAPLPDLVGTKREVGFAMEIRHQALMRMLTSRRMPSASILSENRVIEAFILDAISSKWGPLTDTQSASPDVIELLQGAEALEKMGFHGLTFRTRLFQPTTVPEVLSSWILYKHSMENNSYFYKETDAQYWIRQHKGMLRFQENMPRSMGASFAESLASDIVARAVTWGSRGEAYAAFLAMTTHNGSIEKQVLTTSDGGTSLQDMLEQMQVMRALAGEEPYAMTPF